MDTQSDSNVLSDSTNNDTGKKSRRQVAFYPNMNAANKPIKPFSRSAAKRESVMALGSIEHLQHYFTKSGISADSNPLMNKPNSGMVPAIGSLSTLKLRPPALNDVQHFALPPSPIVPEIVQPVFSPHNRSYEIDPENLRPGVIEDLAAVEQAWLLNGTEFRSLLGVEGSSSKASADTVDVLELLKTTTHAVRSVRNYLVSLPDDPFSPQQPNFRALQSVPPLRRQASQPNLASDPLSLIRVGALEVLIVLRALEESSRLPLSDDAYDAQSDHGGDIVELGSTTGSGSTSGSGGHSRGPSPDFLDADVDTSISFVQVGGGLRSVPVWDDENTGQDFNRHEDEAKERWDERLVLGGGWLYRQDVKRDELTKEKEVVSHYLDVVDQILFGGTKDGKRGWEREKLKSKGKGSRRASAGDIDSHLLSGRSRGGRRVVSTGMLDAMKSTVVTEEPEELEPVSETESVDDDDLPEWAKRSTFQDDPIGRAHALIQALLPSSLQHLIPSFASDKQNFLKSLASGQVLCVAYNVGVRKSRKPWGYVSKDAIHDIATLETQSQGETQEQLEKAKKGWTFRRTDNLRLWSAALKLRYMIPIVSPNPSKSGTASGKNTPVPSPSPSMQRFPSGTPPVLFDAPVVARLDPGWEEMLETVVNRWVNAVVEEKRGDR